MIVDYEKTLHITYQPQAVFRVRGVTRCTSSLTGTVREAANFVVLCSQCFASGSRPGSGVKWVYGSGSRQAKIAPQRGKIWRKIMFEYRYLSVGLKTSPGAWMSLCRGLRRHIWRRFSIKKFFYILKNLGPNPDPTTAWSWSRSGFSKMSRSGSKFSESGSKTLVVDPEWFIPAQALILE